jgi:hypothetical protein
MPVLEFSRALKAKCRMTTVALAEDLHVLGDSVLTLARGGFS